jgi:disulfide bond formation protein DsbB
MSLIGFLIKKFYILNKLLIIFASVYGIAVSLKLIYLQNLSPEEIAMLPMGCDMPLETQIEYFGLFGGLANAFKGGPTCAEESWRFIFNFAEWGLVFFVMYFLATLLKLKISLFGSKTT